MSSVDLGRLSPTSQFNEAVRRSLYEAEVPRTAEEEQAQIDEALLLSTPPKQLEDCGIPAALADLIALYALPQGIDDPQHHIPRADRPSELIPALRTAFTGVEGTLQPTAHIEYLRQLDGTFINKLLRSVGDDVDLLPEPYQTFIKKDLEALQMAQVTNDTAASPEERVPEPRTIQATVTHLNVNVHSGINPDKIRKLAVTFPFVTSLNLGGVDTGFNDDCMRELVRHLPRLQSVDLNNNNQLSRAGSDMLLQFENLRHASVLSIRHVNRDALRAKGVNVAH